MITGIVVALPEELDTLTCLPGCSGKIVKGSFAFVSKHLALAYSGAGPKNAQLAAELLVANGVTRLISWGCAAALDETLTPGDLVLADVLIDSEGARNSNSCLHADWHSHTKNLLSSAVIVHAGGLAESESIVSSHQDKKQLRSKTNAIALDMESVAIAKVAGQHHLPYLSIRAIADPASMDLPKSINYAVNDQGDIVLRKLLFFLTCHPTELPGLIKLGLYFNAAKKTLRLVARQLTTILDFKEISNQQPI